MTDHRGRSGRKTIVSNLTLATEDVAVVGARVQAHLTERQQQGDIFPHRPKVSLPAVLTVDEQLDQLRAQFGATSEETDARIAAVAARADAAAVRAHRLLTASQALAVDLDRLSAVLPPDVAVELDAAVARFNEGLRTA